MNSKNSPQMSHYLQIKHKLIIFCQLKLLSHQQKWIFCFFIDSFLYNVPQIMQTISFLALSTVICGFVSGRLGNMVGNRWKIMSYFFQNGFNISRILDSWLLKKSSCVSVNVISCFRIQCTIVAMHQNSNG